MALVQRKVIQQGFSTDIDVSVTMDSALTAGNTLVWTATGGDFSTNENRTVVITDTAGNDAKYTEVQMIFIDTNTMTRRGYARNINGGSAVVTATFDEAANYAGLEVAEYDDQIDATTPFTTGEKADSGGKQFTPGTGADGVTTANMPALSTQPKLLFGWSQNVDSANAPTAGTGFTSQGTGFNAGSGGDTARWEYKRVTATTAVPATFTATVNETHVSLVFALQEAAAGDDSASPTGVAGSGAVGTLAANSTASTTLTGVSATSGIGALTETHASAITPTGVIATGSAGEIGPIVHVDMTLVGTSATGSPGVITAQAADAQVNPTGVAGTGAVGALTANGTASTTLTGVAATGGIGALTETHTANITPTGVAATGQVGTLTGSSASSPSVAISGNEAAALVGTITVTANGMAAPTGVSSATSVGVLIGTGTGIAAVMGVSAATAVGVLNASIGVSTELIGVQTTGLVGALSAGGDAVQSLFGVTCYGYAGVISFNRPPLEPGRTFSVARDYRYFRT